MRRDYSKEIAEVMFGIWLIFLSAILLSGCGSAPQKKTATTVGFKPIQVEEIQVEHLETENIITENVITWDSNVTTWD